MSAVLYIKDVKPFDGYSPEMLPSFIARLVVGNLTYFAFTAVYKLLPLGIGGAILSTDPIFVVILAAIVLSDKVRVIEVVSIAISIVGIVLMSIGDDPDPMILQDEIILLDKSGSEVKYLTGIALAIATSIGMAIAAIVSRKLKGFNTIALTFHMMWSGTVMSVVLFLFEDKATPYFRYDDSSTYLLLLIAGLANASAMLMLQYAWQHCRSSEVALLRYIQVIYNFSIDLVVFHEEFTMLQVIGAATVLLTNFTVVLIKTRAEKEKETSPDQMIQLTSDDKTIKK